MVEDERRLLTFRGLSTEIRHFFGASIEYPENGGPRFASRRRVPAPARFSASNAPRIASLA
jgi:hypothetical protein